MKSISKGFKLILVNCLWLICSLPLFTIGASTCAACYVCLKLLNDEDGDIYTWFFKSFKENFKQGTIIWFFVAPALYAASLCWTLLIGDDAGFFGKIGCVGYISVLTISAVFLFPLMAHYHNSIKSFVKNSFVLGLQYLTKTLIEAILIVLVAALWSFNFITQIIGLFFMPGIIIFIMCFYAKPVFEYLDRPKDKIIE